MGAHLRQKLFDRQSDRTIYLLATLFFTLTVNSFYPGYLSADSIGQAVDAVTHNFTDHHPPILAFIWSKFWSWWPGADSMFALHLAMYWFAAVLFARRMYQSSPLHALLVLTVGLTPPVLALLSTVWKDVAIGSSVLLVAALTWQMENNYSRKRFFGVISIAFYGLAVRYNSLPLFLPYFFWIAYIVTGNEFPELRKRYKLRGLFAGGIALTVALQSLVALFNWSVTRTKSNFGDRVILIHDLAAISIRADDWDELRDLYTPYYRSFDREALGNINSQFDSQKITSVFLACSSTNTQGELPWKTDLPPLPALRSLWMKQIAEHPKEYLSHRMLTFYGLLGLGNPSYYETYVQGVETNPLGLAFHPSWFNRVIMTYLEMFKNTAVMRPYPYVLLSLLVIIALRRKRTGTKLFLVGAVSNLLYTASWFPVAQACSFRYLWSVVPTSMFLAICLHFYLIKGSPKNYAPPRP